MIKLRIEYVERGDDFIKVIASVVDSPDIITATTYLTIPDSSKIGESKTVRAIGQLKMFMDTFGLDYTRPFHPEEDWIGAEAWAHIEEDEKWH